MAETVMQQGGLQRGMRLVHALIDFFFPPACVLCGTWIGSYQRGRICAPCAALFGAAGSPLCSCCGLLFESREGADHLCSRCLQQEYFFDAARSLARYEGAVRQVIHRFKYRDCTMLGAPLGRLMAEHGRRLLPAVQYDVIVPVPLHPDRLRERGYNQAVLLCRSIGASWQVPVDYTSLQRMHPTPPQVTLMSRERLRNVRGNFLWTGASLAGRCVLLVDDVMTTGATLSECGRALKAAHAQRVDCLTLAQTPRGGSLL